MSGPILLDRYYRMLPRTEGIATIITNRYCCPAFFESNYI